MPYLQFEQSFRANIQTKHHDECLSMLRESLQLDSDDSGETISIRKFKILVELYQYLPL